MNPHFNHPEPLIIGGIAYPIFAAPILPHWAEAARDKGYDLVDRVLDRLHVALRCRKCDGLSRTRIFTLMSAQPLCPACQQAEWRTDATAAGLTFLRRDPADHHYGIYQAPCGHEVTRQFTFIKHVAQGQTGLRCEFCHHAVEAAEAAAQGWTLMGPDPKGDPAYRHYRHDACGHQQRIARANVLTSRFACGKCAKNWAAAPSFIYLLHFTLASGREVIKLGYSNNPLSRLHHQLKGCAEMPCAIIRRISMPTGRAALMAEKQLHKKLRRTHPQAVIDPKVYRGQILVGSEIYDAALTPIILAALDRIATAPAAPAA